VCVPGGRSTCSVGQRGSGNPAREMIPLERQRPACRTSVRCYTGRTGGSGAMRAQGPQRPYGRTYPCALASGESRRGEQILSIAHGLSTRRTCRVRGNGAPSLFAWTGDGDEYHADAAVSEHADAYAKTSSFRNSHQYASSPNSFGTLSALALSHAGNGVVGDLPRSGWRRRQGGARRFLRQAPVRLDW